VVGDGDMFGVDVAATLVAADSVGALITGLLGVGEGSCSLAHEANNIAVTTSAIDADSIHRKDIDSFIWLLGRFFDKVALRALGIICYSSLARKASHCGERPPGIVVVSISLGHPLFWHWQ